MLGRRQRWRPNIEPAVNSTITNNNTNPTGHTRLLRCSTSQRRRVPVGKGRSVFNFIAQFHMTLSVIITKPNKKWPNLYFDKNVLGTPL